MAADNWKDQPRWPAGDPRGGQWRPEGGYSGGGANIAKQSARFVRFADTATARAYGDSIGVNPDDWRTYDAGRKRDIIAHELAHNVVEDLIYKSPEEWAKAADALLIDSGERNGRLYWEFMLGQSKFGEAIVEAISAYVNEHQDPMLDWDEAFHGRPPVWSPEKWQGAMDWAEHALALAGYDKDAFNKEVKRIIEELDYD